MVFDVLRIFHSCAQVSPFALLSKEEQRCLISDNKWQYVPREIIILSVLILQPQQQSCRLYPHSTYAGGRRKDNWWREALNWGAGGSAVERLTGYGQITAFIHFSLLLSTDRREDYYFSLRSTA